MTLANTRIALVFGTRPEVIKVAGLAHRHGPDAVLINTGQHWDDAMSGVFLRDLGMGRPHHDLGLGGRSRGEQIRRRPPRRPVPGADGDLGRQPSG